MGSSTLIALVETSNSLTEFNREFDNENMKLTMILLAFYLCYISSLPPHNRNKRAPSAQFEFPGIDNIGNVISGIAGNGINIPNLPFLPTTTTTTQSPFESIGNTLGKQHLDSPTVSSTRADQMETVLSQLTMLARVSSPGLLAQELPTQFLETLVVRSSRKL